MEDRWRRCWLAGWGGGGRLGGADTETTHLDLADLTGARPAGREGRWLVVEVPAQHSSASAILLDLLRPTPVLGGGAPAAHHLLVRRRSSSTSSCCCSPATTCSCRGGQDGGALGGEGEGRRAAPWEEKGGDCPFSSACSHARRERLGRAGFHTTHG
jgi:hypothetical protein